MYIEHLDFANVGPFRDAHFDFHPQVNVFTGPNNSGKSTVLWVLGDAAVYPFSFPDKLLRDGETATFNLQMSNGSNFCGELPVRRVTGEGIDATDGYWTLEHWQRHVQLLTDVGYSKFIPAMRRPTDFRSPGPTTKQDSPSDVPVRLAMRQNEMLATLVGNSPQRARARRQAESDPELQKRITLVSDDPSLVSDEEVIQQIVELDYRSYLRRNPALRSVVDKVAQMASDITEGFVMAFNGVDEDSNGFYPSFKTLDGVIPLNSMSQGTQSVIQWLAHLVIGYAEYYDFPDRLEDAPGILIVDEIDAHLHPAWQRGIIPTLTHHFPHLQIFCSTHSPLMLAGLGRGQIQLLTRNNEDNSVQVSRNDYSVAGWSADQILRNLLGVRNPTDRKTIENFDRLEELQMKGQLTPEESGELEQLALSNEALPPGGSASILANELARGIRELLDESSSLHQ